MCPLAEAEQRMAEKDLAAFEIVPSTALEKNPTVDFQRAVKKYKRSSADQAAVRPEDLRPLPVLLVTFGYLIGPNVLLDMRYDFADKYHFIRDRFRSIRQDLGYQSLTTPETAQLYESIVRFHILSDYLLCDRDLSVFDRQINNEQMTKSLISLMDVYRQNPGVSFPNRAECSCFFGLLMLDSKEASLKRSAFLKSLPPSIFASSDMRFALLATKYFTAGNWVRILELMWDAPFLHACLLRQLLGRLRVVAVNALNRSLHKTGPLNLSELRRMLAFENDEVSIEFLRHLFLPVEFGAEYRVVFGAGPLVEPDRPFPEQRESHIIERKRIGLDDCAVITKQGPQSMFVPKVEIPSELLPVEGAQIPVSVSETRGTSFVTSARVSCFVPPVVRRTVTFPVDVEVNEDAAAMVISPTQPGPDIPVFSQPSISPSIGIPVVETQSSRSEFQPTEGSPVRSRVPPTVDGAFPRVFIREGEPICVDRGEPKVTTAVLLDGVVSESNGPFRRSPAASPKRHATASTPVLLTVGAAPVGPNLAATMPLAARASSASGEKEKEKTEQKRRSERKKKERRAGKEGRKEWGKKKEVPRPLVPGREFVPSYGAFQRLTISSQSQPEWRQRRQPSAEHLPSTFRKPSPYVSEDEEAVTGEPRGKGVEKVIEKGRSDESPAPQSLVPVPDLMQERGPSSARAKRSGRHRKQHSTKKSVVHTPAPVSQWPPRWGHLGNSVFSKDDSRVIGPKPELQWQVRRIVEDEPPAPVIVRESAPRTSSNEFPELCAFEGAVSATMARERTQQKEYGQLLGFWLESGKPQQI